MMLKQPEFARFLRGQVYTPLKINMEPQNEGLEDVFPFQMGDFRFHVSFLGCSWVCLNTSDCFFCDRKIFSPPRKGYDRHIQ